MLFSQWLNYLSHISLDVEVTAAEIAAQALCSTMCPILRKLRRMWEEET